MTNSTQTPPEVHPEGMNRTAQLTLGPILSEADSRILTDERMFELYIQETYGFDGLFTMYLSKAIEREAKEAGTEFVRGRVERRNDDGNRIGPFCYLDIKATTLIEEIIVATLDLIRTSVVADRVEAP